MAEHRHEVDRAPHSTSIAQEIRLVEGMARVQRFPCLAGSACGALWAAAGGAALCIDNARATPAPTTTTAPTPRTIASVRLLFGREVTAGLPTADGAATGGAAWAVGGETGAA